MEQVEDSRTTKPPTVVMSFGYPTQPNSADGQATSIGRENATHNLKLLQYGMGHFLLPSTQVAQDTQSGGRPTIQFPYKGHHVHV